MMFSDFSRESAIIESKLPKMGLHRSEGFPQTGYFIPVRYLLGVWPARKIVGASPPSPSASCGDSGGHSGHGTIFGVFKLEFRSYESSQNFETGVLHRISSRIYLEEWFGLGSRFGKGRFCGLISKNKMSFPWKTIQKMISAPNVPRDPKGRDYKTYLAWNWPTAQK